MTINRLLPFIIAVSHFVLLEIILFSPKMIFVVLLILALIDFFAARQFLLAGKRKEKIHFFIILPVIFSFSLVFFTIILPSRPLVHFLFAVSALFNYFYFKTIYYYLVNPAKYRKNSLENISSYGNFLGFYFMASAIYGLQIFLNIEIWQLMSALLFFSLLIVYQVFWANRIDSNARFFYMLVLALMIVELAWAISFMSLNYYILGLILAIFYYTVIGLSRFYLLKTLNRQTVKAYLALGIGSILLVLFTANWISYN